MENELALDIQNIIVTPGTIEFNDFEKIKKQAHRLAAHIGTVEVNEDNIKTSKKMLAAVNKRVKELEDTRISIKKAINEPYKMFEDQVKEIVSIVKEADNDVRKQVRYLEEFERLQKEEELQQLFYKRSQFYSLGDVIRFEEFLQARHLNKTTSVEAVEKEMTSFLEKIAADYKTILKLPNAKDVLSAFIGRYDLGQALDIVNAEKEREEALKASGALKEIETDNHTFLLMIYEEKDFKLVKFFCEQNEIKFNVKEGF